jgi:hypothetical protein
MIIVRDVFQAKYGRGDELVGLFREMQTMMPQDQRLRILTDASGQFFTVVTEMEVASLSDWEKSFTAEMAGKDFAAWFERMVPLVDSGHREFYNVVN